MQCLGFMLGELEISNLTAGFLGFVALVFVVSFGAVSYTHLTLPTKA